jgi:hypothetical protein
LMPLLLAGLTTVLTVAASINPQGVIAGYSADSSFVHHGFLRSPSGTFTTFDAPGAATELGPGYGRLLTQRVRDGYRNLYRR